MKYFESTTDLELHHSIISLGKFDGVHLGHRAIFDYMKSYQKNGFQTIVFTLSNHPNRLFSDPSMQLIYTKEEKKQILEEVGLDVLISYPFTKETALLEPEEFIKDILVEQLGGKIIVVGHDFRFGHNRAGDIQLLKQLSKKYDYKVVVFEKIKIDDKIVSSSHIREELLDGNMQKVNKLLGRPYSITEEIIHGKELGRTLGMPTTNMIPRKEKLLPPNGVYASSIKIQDQLYTGITNIGYKPTVGAEHEKGVETFIFDYSGDLYGKKLTIQLYKYIRPEQKFLNLEALKQQMLKDVCVSKTYFLSVYK